MINTEFGLYSAVIPERFIFTAHNCKKITDPPYHKKMHWYLVHKYAIKN